MILGDLKVLLIWVDLHVNSLAFCHFPENIDTATFSNMSTVLHSEEGSNKRATENVILSYWHDYLQDTEDGETMVTLNDDCVIFHFWVETITANATGMGLISWVSS